eukprot:357060-Chlamydomonas_euryale.AAC.6
MEDSGVDGGTICLALHLARRDCGLRGILCLVPLLLCLTCTARVRLAAPHVRVHVPMQCMRILPAAPHAHVRMPVQRIHICLAAPHARVHVSLIQGHMRVASRSRVLGQPP